MSSLQYNTIHITFVAHWNLELSVRLWCSESAWGTCETRENLSCGIIVYESTPRRVSTRDLYNNRSAKELNLLVTKLFSGIRGQQTIIKPLRLSLTSEFMHAFESRYYVGRRDNKYNTFVLFKNFQYLLTKIKL